jgi:glycosyltransferase involved in cell wall biosynthesis
MKSPGYSDPAGVACTRRPVTVLSIPHLNPPENPNYFNFFYDALKPYGVAVHPDYQVSDQWLTSHADEINVVHCHWPEYLWKNAPGFAGEFKCLWGLRRFFSLVRRLGKRLVWTAHNHFPHEKRILVDYLGYRSLASRADLIIAHSRWSMAELPRLYPIRGEMVLMPHGSYAGFTISPNRDRGQVLSDLGLRDDLPLLACLGSIRRYKGLELAVETVMRDCTGVQLVIAGKPDLAYLPELQSMVSDACNRIRLIGKFVPPVELAELAAASDLAILPYRDITTSAVLVYAWSYGKAAVAPALPYFREMIGGAEGFLAPEYGVRGFGQAIRRALSVPEEVRREAATTRALELKWDRIVPPVAAKFTQWCKA